MTQILNRSLPIALLFALCACSESSSGGTDGEPDAGLADASVRDAARGEAGADAEVRRDGGLSADTDAPDMSLEAGCAEGAEAPCWAWGRELTGPSNEIEIDAVASDAQGNVYISGKFIGEVSIAGVAETLTSAGYDPSLPDLTPEKPGPGNRADIFVVKYDRGGAYQWHKQYGADGEDNIFDVTCDAQGNVILSGITQGEVMIEGVKVEATAGGADALFVKLTGEGELVWVSLAQSAGDDGGNELAIAPDGTILATVDAKEDLSAPPLPVFEHKSFKTAYVFAIDPETGAFEWGRQVRGGVEGGRYSGGSARGKCLGVDGSGAIYFGGDFRGTVEAIGPNRSLSMDVSGRGDPTRIAPDAFASRWSAGGDLEWVRSWGGEGEDLCKGVAGLREGGAYVIGYFERTASFGDESLSVESSRDQYAWRIDEAGETVWLRQIASRGFLQGSEIELAQNGDLIFGVRFEDAIDFGTERGAPVRVEKPAGGQAWPALVRYSAGGAFVHAALPERSGWGGADEISRSGDRVYLDVPARGGPFSFGRSTFSVGATKDAAIAAIDLR